MMGLKNTIKDLLLQFRHWKYMRECADCDEFRRTRNNELIIKTLHSLEKGLSSEPLKPFFGQEKIMKLFEFIEESEKDGESIDNEVMQMIISVLSEYFSVNNSFPQNNDNYTRLKEKAAGLGLLVLETEKKGGTKEVTGIVHADMPLEECILSRHCIRRFSDSAVDMGKLKAAIELALNCPSACNRQAVHVYILDSTKFDLLGPYRDGGMKGFSGNVDKMLLITGIVSAYEKSEPYQYIVSAGILAGYLTLTLHTAGFGACPIERPVLRTSQWEIVSGNLGIPKDEQLVCMMAVGVPEEGNIKVPYSNRLGLEKMITAIN